MSAKTTAAAATTAAVNTAASRRHVDRRESGANRRATLARRRNVRVSCQCKPQLATMTGITSHQCTRSGLRNLIRRA
jgi:hypothetical protein